MCRFWFSLRRIQKEGELPNQIWRQHETLGRYHPDLWRESKFFPLSQNVPLSLPSSGWDLTFQQLLVCSKLEQSLSYMLKIPLKNRKSFSINSFFFKHHSKESRNSWLNPCCFKIASAVFRASISAKRLQYFWGQCSKFAPQDSTVFSLTSSTYPKSLFQLVL